MSLSSINNSRDLEEKSPDLDAFALKGEADEVVVVLEGVDACYEEYKKGAGLSITPEQASTLTYTMSFHRLVKKIDRVVLPVFLITEALQYLDKTALNYAQLNGAFAKDPKVVWVKNSNGLTGE
ncbi:hypothetical protein MPER_01702 [Moniliophthora perniciosa FA553]|nr:hypothetical protein MPER_01702 [Moniliophthora perniciosa FA553]